MHKRLLLVGFWLAGTLVAVGVGLTAIALIGNGLTTSGSPSTSAQEIAQALGEGTVDAVPADAGTNEPGVTQTVRVPGVGSVVARCTGDLVEAVSWSPEQGYRAELAGTRSAPRTVVVFEGSARDVTVTLTCADGVPRGSAVVAEDDRDGPDDREDREGPAEESPAGPGSSGDSSGSGSGDFGGSGGSGSGGSSGVSGGGGDDADDAEDRQDDDADRADDDAEEAEDRADDAEDGDDADDAGDDDADDDYADDD